FGLDVGGDQRVQAGLEDRYLAAAQACDLVTILVDAGDLVAEIGKAGAGNQPHIARANHGDSHQYSLLLTVNGRSDSVRLLKHLAAKRKPEKRRKTATQTDRKSVV